MTLFWASQQKNLLFAFEANIFDIVPILICIKFKVFLSFIFVFIFGKQHYKSTQAGPTLGAKNVTYKGTLVT